MNKDELYKKMLAVMEKNGVTLFNLSFLPGTTIIIVQTLQKLSDSIYGALRAAVPVEFELKFEVLPKLGGDWNVSCREPRTPDTDAVAHPKHYNFGRIEVIEFIEDQRLGYHLGNAVKYICRAGRKDPAKTIEDLSKAKWYLSREIEKLEAEKQNRVAVRPNEMNK